MLDRHVDGDDEQAAAEQHARDEATEEQGTNRYAARGQRVDDHVVRRRNQHALAGTRNRDGRRELRRVAGLDHHRDLHGAQRRDIGHSRARNAAEEHRSHDIHMREAAAESSDQRIRKREQAVGNTADAHDLTGEDKERNRHQRERVNRFTHLLHERHQRHVHVEHRDGRRAGQRKGNRHARDDKDEERTEQERNRQLMVKHYRAPPSWLSAFSSGSSR